MYYRPIQSISERTTVFERMNAEGLTSLAMSAHKDPSVEFWLEITAPEKCIFLGCFNEAGVLMGCATFSGFRGKSYEFDFTAFREFFGVAVDMARGGFVWIFKNTDAKSIIGISPVKFRHSIKLAKDCGFFCMGQIAGACYLARQKKYVDGVMLCVTPKTLKELYMGFGGGYSAPSAPEYTPPEKPETPKPVTKAATAARDSQKEKAAKAAGIQGSILTSPVQGNTQQKTILGG